MTGRKFMKQAVQHRILIVNDASEQLKLMNQMLRQAGYHVINASDGRQALEIARTELPDLIISDITMPEIDGVELCRMIRASKEINAIPIILVTATVKNSDMMVEGMEAGADDYLEAPFEPMRLIAKVARLLGRKQSEQKLLQRDELLRRLVENFPNGSINVLDEEFRFLLAEGKDWEHRGLTGDQIVGRTLQELFPKTSVDYILPYYRRAFAGEESEFEFFLDDQTYLVRTAPLHDANRFIYAILAVTQNITEHTKVDEIQAMLAAIVESSQDAIIGITLGRIITSWNKGAENLYGYTAAEAIGQPISIILPSDVTDNFHKIFKRLKEGERVVNIESERLTRDGRRLEASVSISLVKDKNGNIIGVSTIAHDITDKKIAEHKLRESEAFSRSILESSADCIAVLDLDCKLLSMNTPGLSIMEIDDFSEFKGKHWIDFWEEDERGKAAKAVESAKNGRTGRFRGYAKTAKDNFKYWDVIVTPILNSHNIPARLLAVSRDVTEQKGAEEALQKSEEQLRQAQKLESVGRLAGGIAHDFNNMLTAINGYSELILSKLEPDNPLRSKVEEIKKAAERSALLTQQLLAFSRKQVLQSKILDLNEVITDTTKMLKHLIGADIELFTSLNSKLCRVEADPGKLSQVIMNLAVNARDAMPKGGKLTIQTDNVFLNPDKVPSRQTKSEDCNFVLMAVSDTGEGMDAETQQHIFEPFYTTKEVGKGTGLGLATVYGIVKQSGGYIEVESKIGKGTTFNIYLPRVVEEIPSLEEDNENQDIKKGAETILLVEDEDLVRDLSREILESYGYKVVEAEDGTAALKLVEKDDFKFDLLMTDIIMPQTGGRELAEKLTEKFPNLKVLFTSGYTDDPAMLHGISHTSTNFIQKPFTPASLMQKVREVLDNEVN
jgi:two-component system, cell cycle sensor histidine kinase and response regulator CckA